MNEGERKTIDDLRATLFATLEGVRNGTVDLDRARTINEIGKTIIDTAKVEVDYLRVTDGGESEFLSSAIGAANLPPGLPPAGAQDGPRNGITGIVRHRMRG